MSTNTSLSEDLRLVLLREIIIEELHAFDFTIYPEDHFEQCKKIWWS
jgi:hypothetical protein